VDVSGLAGQKVSQLRIVTAQALIATDKGEASATFHQMALRGTGKSILSCLQMEAFGADINDRSRMLPRGNQRILVDVYQLPLEFINGLPYLRCCKPTKAELDLLPHIIMTSDVEWDPSLYDNIIEDIEKFHDTTEDEYEHEDFNCYGEYCHRSVAKDSTLPLTRLSALILMISLMISLMSYTLNVFVISMALMLAMLLQLSLTSSSYVLSLDGHLMIQSSKR
jgi:hypothetical protein